MLLSWPRSTFYRFHSDLCMTTIYWMQLHHLTPQCFHRSRSLHDHVTADSRCPRLPFVGTLPSRVRLQLEIALHRTLNIGTTSSLPTHPLESTSKTCPSNMARKQARRAASSQPAKARPVQRNKSVVAKPNRHVKHASAKSTRRSDRIKASYLYSTEHRVPQTSRLLTIPPEIRNLIYEYALCDSPKVKVNKPCKGLSTTRQPEPAILRTCTQIRNEATSIYYGQTTFVAFGVWVLQDWARSLGAGKAHLLRRLLAIRYSYQMGGWRADFYETVDNIYKDPRYSQLVPEEVTWTGILPRV